MDEASKEKDTKYEEVVFAVNKTICENLKSLLEARHLSQRQFCKQLAEQRTSITRSYFSKILADPKYISAAFLLSCCDFFGISLKNLVSTDFDASEYIYNNTEDHKDYLNIKALLQKNDLLQPNPTSDMNYMDVPANFPPPFNSTNLVSDPSHTLFTGYLQDYYCYYYPTHSSENKEEEIILKGILRLEAESNYCKSTLKIDTNTVDDDGNINYKSYIGYATISPTVNSLNCIMYSDSLCEYCFLMFRFFKLNFGKQDCRIAEVLSSSSAAEDRRPTVLRMLLSREPIKDNDLKIVAPAFSLNYSTIAISKENLEKIGDTSDVYREIVGSLMDNNTSTSMYFCKEDSVFNIALKYLKQKESVQEFIMLLRADSYAYRYNKVSTKADEAVRRILLSKGYYKKNSGREMS